MPAYLVCCHFGTAVKSVLLQSDTDTWAGWEFYASMVSGQRIHLPLWCVKPLMV